MFSENPRSVYIRQRAKQIEDPLLYQYPSGLTREERARRLEVNKTTVVKKTRIPSEETRMREESGE